LTHAGKAGPEGVAEEVEAGMQLEAGSPEPISDSCPQ
jgi:hypothetical protein